MKRKTMAAAIAAGLLTAAAPADAAMLVTGGGSSPTGGTINATCAGPAGLATDFNEITYAVDVNGAATHKNPGVVPVAVGVTCKVVNASTGTTYGSVRSGTPGPVVVGAGVVSFPGNVEVRACIEANAVFSDGSTARFDNC